MVISISMKSISNFVTGGLVCAATGLALGVAPPAAGQVCDQWVQMPLLGGTNFARKVVEYNGDLVIAGLFSTVGGVTVNHVARWDGMAWQPMGTGLPQSAEDLIVYEGHLIAVGGTFVRRWDAATESWPTMNQGLVLDSYTNCLAIHDGSLFLGTANRVHRWNGPVTPPGAGSWSIIGNFGDVHALLSFNGDLVAGGTFTAPGNRVARWDGTSWHNLGAGINQSVQSLHTHNGVLLAGLRNPLQNADVFKWNGSNWAPVGPGNPLATYAFVTYAGELYKASDTLGVQRYDGVNWQPVSSLRAYGFFVQGSRLYVGGYPYVEFIDQCAGACCVNGGCLSLSEADCAAIGGVFLGPATTCADAQCQPAPTCPADISPPGGDGVVNVNDLLMVINEWGACPK